MPHTLGGLVKDMNKFFYDDNWSNTTAPVNIKETENAYEVQVIAPGLNKEDIKIKVEDKSLKVSYEQKEENNEQTDKYVRNEYHFRSFKRSFTLSDKVNAEAITAKYTDGILYVTVPKKETEEKTTKDITVS